MKFTALLLAFIPTLLASPITIHKQNPHYLAHNGKTVVLVTSGEMYGSIVNLDFDYRVYLDTLQKDGLNLVRIFVDGYNEATDAFSIPRNVLSPAPGRYLAPFAVSDTPGFARGGNKYDLDRYEPRYFARLRDFLREAEKRGIFVEVTYTSALYDKKLWATNPFHPGNNINNTPALDYRKLHTLDNGGLVPRQEALLRMIVREINSHDNFYFEIQNEPWADRLTVGHIMNPYIKGPQLMAFPNVAELPDAESLAWQKHMSAAIADEESRLPNRHLIAQNYCNFLCSPQEVDSNVTIMNFHYAYPDVIRVNWNWDRPISYDESGFLTVPPDTGYRKQAWNFLLSGGAVYDGLDLTFYPGFEKGDLKEPNGPAGGGPELRRQLGLLRAWINAIDVAAMRPANELLRKSPGAIGRMLAKPGELYAAYLDGVGPTELEIELPAGSYDAEWFHPASGKREEVRIGTHRGGVLRLTSPRYDEDVALLVRRSR